MRIPMVTDTHASTLDGVAVLAAVTVRGLCARVHLVDVLTCAHRVRRVGCA